MLLLSLRVLNWLVAFALGAACLLFVQSQGWRELRYHFSPATEFADGAYYQGEHDAQGRLQGWGRMQWRNGDSYEGEFKQGLFHGQGQFIQPGVMVYQGEFADGSMQGVGQMRFEDGSRYEGAFQAGHMHGQGKYSDMDGGVYQGEFVRGAMQGDGYWQYSDATTYRGQVERGRRQGQGELTLPDGSRYSGEFASNQMHGKGVYSDAGGGQFSGDFREGSFSGEGTYVSAQGLTYLGEFEHWRLNGKGQHSDEQGNLWRGQYQHGELDGKGSYLGANGEQYRGEFKAGLYHGVGRWRSPEGDTYRGAFAYGRKHGPGRLVYAEPLDGLRRIQGRWQYDRLVDGGKDVKIYAAEDIAQFAMEQQGSRLQAELERLRPSNPRRIELYSLVVAGDGTEEVFRRESRYLEQMLAERYDAADTSLFLVNSQRSLEKPIANLTSISAAIEQIAERMDKQKDIFFLYITSHGSKNRFISLKQQGISLANIPADWLAEQLRKSGIEHRVVVLSACYSGGFIDALGDDNSLVMTAAAADKTSFGCSDDSRFTYFGRAYFQHALQPGVDFVSAFEQAKALVAGWEEEQSLTPSQPQIHRSAKVEQQLARWQAQLNLQRAEQSTPPSQ